MPSRMEGQNLDYFPALVNAYGVNGFTISGTGTLDGNGLKYWKAFWQRRKENPQCTNLEVSRPRLVFVWKSNDVQVQDEDCEFGFCHAALTCGSEAIHNRNIVMRNCHVNEAMRVLWLKMRPDTPQKYEYITVENITGQAHSLIYVKPWTQFYDLKGRKDVPLSYSEHISLKNIKMDCAVFYDIAITENDKLADFSFENMTIKADNATYDKSIVKGITFKNVVVNGKGIE